jgi:tripartite-type tricarboxylate transporter receptor subunit TctC
MIKLKGHYVLLPCLVLAFLLAGNIVGAFAQDYPTKPVTIIVPFSAGSATDAISRIVGGKLSEIWGQSVVYDNHPGAGGTVGTDVAAKSPADGYTLLVSAAYVSSPATRAKLPYDPMKDFVDIAPLARQAMVIIVGSTSDKKSVSQLIKAAKANPGKLKFGTPGIGSGAHLAAEKFKIGAGIDVVHAPTKGVPKTIAATANGSVDYTILPIAAGLKGMKEGKLRPLAVTSAKRSSLMPEIPTVGEAAVEGYEENLWWGVWTRAGTPSSVADKLAKDIAQALTAPDVLEQLEKRAFEPMSMSRNEFAQFVRREMKVAAHTVKEAGIKPK